MLIIPKKPNYVQSSMRWSNSLIDLRYMEMKLQPYTCSLTTSEIVKKKAANTVKHFETMQKCFIAPWFRFSASKPVPNNIDLNFYISFDEPI